MKETPRLVLDAHAWLGESPMWDADRALLWWVDILAGLVHAFEPSTRADRSYTVGSEVGCVAPIDDGQILIAAAERIATLNPDDGSLTTVVTFAEGMTRSRCNDGRADPAGRFWVGRVGSREEPGAGLLIRLGRDGRLDTVLDGLTMPNGLAWPSDGKSLAFIDSACGDVASYPYDPVSGNLGSPSQLISIADLRLGTDAVPDGMAIDDEDHLWIAIWGAGCVLRISPNGAVVDRVELPVSQPSSCAFGGPDLRDLYVTSAREGFGLVDEAREPHAGGLFRVRPGPRGRRPDPYRPLPREVSR